MSNQHHDTYLEWLYLEADDALSPGERSRLESHLRTCTECRAERAALATLDGLLEGSKVPARKDLRREVMLSLPAAGWESRSPRSWAAAAALLVALLGGAMAVSYQAPTGSDPTVWSAMDAVVDLFRATLLAGGGLLTASWQSLGLAIERALGGSAWNLGAFAVLVLGLDILFVRLLIRAARRADATETVNGGGGRNRR